MAFHKANLVEIDKKGIKTIDLCASALDCDWIRANRLYKLAESCNQAAIDEIARLEAEPMGFDDEFD